MWESNHSLAALVAPAQPTFWDCYFFTTTTPVFRTLFVVYKIVSMLVGFAKCCCWRREKCTLNKVCAKMWSYSTCTKSVLAELTDAKKQPRCLSGQIHLCITFWASCSCMFALNRWRISTRRSLIPTLYSRSKWSVARQQKILCQTTTLPPSNVHWGGACCVHSLPELRWRTWLTATRKRKSD